MSRLDKALLWIGAFVAVGVPFPFLIAGRWPLRGLIVTDVVGFGLYGVVLLRAFWRASYAYKHMRRMRRLAEEAERHADQVFAEALRERGEPRGPLS